MKLTSYLAKKQLKINRRRTVWTLIGIVLSVAMLTAVYGFALGGRDLLTSLSVGQMEAVGEAVITEDGGMQGEVEYIQRQIFYSSRFTRTFATIAAVLSVVIVGISVVVISNAFRVSAAERLRQFGLLKSVGATKKQIRQTVLYESFFIAMLGIPVGLALGLAVQFIGVQIANHFLHILVRGAAESLRFTVLWEILLAAVFVSFLTTTISAWIPARRAAKISAIDAIRGLGEVKVKSAKKRGNRNIFSLAHINQAVFGFTGALAYKTSKRNRRNFRATAISLTIGIVLFIGVMSFSSTVERSVNIVFRDYTDATVVVELFNRGSSGTADYTFVNNQMADEITMRLRGFEDTDVMGVGHSRYFYTTDIPISMISQAFINHGDGSYFLLEDDSGHQTMHISLITTDPDTYAELARQAGVPLGSSILINHFTTQYQTINPDGTLGQVQFVDLIPYDFQPQTLILVDNEDEPATTLSLDGQLGRNDLPSEVWDAAAGNMLAVIVPELDSSIYTWYATPDDSWAFNDYVDTIISEFFPTASRPANNNPSDAGIFIQSINLEEESWIIANTATMIMVFVHGFVALLILIGMTNIISTISTNIYARAREFAVLRSVGMDERGLSRMLGFESVFCSLKALVFGISLGVLASYIIHHAVTDVIAFAYEPPLLTIAQSVIGVLAITWLIMRHTASRLKKRSIIETIRTS